MQYRLEAKHQRLEAEKAFVDPMGHSSAASSLVALFIASLAFPVACGDTVISSEEVKILEAGEFEDPSEWSFVTTTGFSTDQADYTIGMVADGEMSFIMPDRIISRNTLGQALDVVPVTPHSEKRMESTLGPRTRHNNWGVQLPRTEFYGHRACLTSIALLHPRCSPFG